MNVSWTLSRHSSARRLLATVLMILLIPVAHAADGIRTERVQFAKGANSAVVEGRIGGYETVDYLLRAAKGQQMNVSMATDNNGNYFNLLAPGENEVAFFNGSSADNQYEGVLPATGDYKIRVYLMRSAARRNENAAYRLEMIVSGASRPTATGTSAPAAKTPTAATAGAGQYDATGKTPCAQFRGQPMGQCDFGVSRGANGSATVLITRPDGSKRAIFFTAGKATGADTSQAEGPMPFSVRREGDLNLIRVGEERYEIPDAAVFGG
jgi:hypothetical protein